MSEIELYGLMAIAKEQQKTAEQAGKQAEAANAALAQAAAIHRQSVAELTKTAQEAIATAIRVQSAELAAPMQQAAQRVTEAAGLASRALSGVALWVYTALFLSGVLFGAAAWEWYQSRKASQVVNVQDVIEYLRKNPSQGLQQDREQKR
jgi:hypothetical protein